MVIIWVIWVLWYYPIYLRFEKNAGFLQFGYLLNHPFFHGMFHYKSSILGGTPMSMETPGTGSFWSLKNVDSTCETSFISSFPSSKPSIYKDFSVATFKPLVSEPEHNARRFCCGSGTGGSTDIDNCPGVHQKRLRMFIYCRISRLNLFDMAF